MPKELAEKIPDLNSQTSRGNELTVFAHLYGVIGDWYICEISEDRRIAFGYQYISSEKEWEMEESIPNKKEWGDFSIEALQKMVNDEFLKEKDIRFLIVRDIFWEETKFSNINIDKQSLNYPGSTN
tara:strand:+ start:449 stop:826 length:378 start_codon:yes stop_codon:yes gene_type:complete